MPRTGATTRAAVWQTPQTPGPVLGPCALETLAAARPRAVRSVIISYRYAGRPWIQVRTLITRRTNPARRAPAPGAPKQPPDLMITVGCCRMQQETHRDHEVQGFMFAPVTLGSPPRMDLDGRDSYG